MTPCTEVRSLGFCEKAIHDSGDCSLSNIFISLSILNLVETLQSSQTQQHDLLANVEGQGHENYHEGGGVRDILKPPAH